jgi:GntR family negative regulator for fad regulon and positive regulator of fabA
MRPAQLVEHHIVTGILDGSYSPGKPLPSERQLAEHIGVARPPLRETLHRLATEGWLTIAHGKPTMVNDYWQKGGMGLLSTLARYIDTLPSGFVSHLMAVRASLLPRIAGLAAANAPAAILAFLRAADALDDNIDALVQFDWRLQILLAQRSGNPIYRLILNDFSSMFQALAADYFALAQARKASRTYYRDLAAAVAAGPQAVETVVAAAMNQSVALWERLNQN